MTKEIQLSKGYVALVDNEDYEYLSQWSWVVMCHKGRNYAYRASRQAGHHTTIYMHREVLGVPRGVLVDHRNGNGLDNQRSNLRRATSAQNSRNRRGVGPSGYKGVSIHKSSGLWQAKITAGRQFHLGYFKTPLEAAYAFDTAARIHHGEFARLNFADEVQA